MGKNNRIVIIFDYGYIIVKNKYIEFLNKNFILFQFFDGYIGMDIYYINLKLRNISKGLYMYRIEKRILIVVLSIEILIII